MYQSCFKRILDFIAALLGLTILLVPLLIIAIIIKIDNGGPVLFLQERSGKDRHPFKIWKFRTMHKSTNAALPTRDCPHGDAVSTPFQQFLRMSSIDELPQLVNILKGDMSLVGPRPVICIETDLLDARDQNRANALRPGLTGWAQINGRDNIDNITKAKLDGEYAQKISFWFDVKCLFLSVFHVIQHKDFNDEEREVL